MKKWVINCDKCGKEIEGNPARLEFYETERDDVSPIKLLYQPDQDYCVDCVTELIALIDNFKPTNEEEKVEKKAESKKPRKRRVDVGKIWALYDAGWKTKDIAIDVECTPQTVRNILNADRPIPEYEKENAADLE